MGIVPQTAQETLRDGPEVDEPFFREGGRL